MISALTIMSRGASNLMVVSLIKSAVISTSSSSPWIVMFPAPSIGAVFTMARVAASVPPEPVTELSVAAASTVRPAVLVSRMLPP